MQLETNGLNSGQQRRRRGGAEEAQRRRRGGPEEAQRRRRGGPEEAQRRTRGGPEEAQRRTRGGPEEAQRRTRGGPKEDQRRRRGGPEEAQSSSETTMNKPGDPEVDPSPYSRRSAGQTAHRQAAASHRSSTAAARLPDRGSMSRCSNGARRMKPPEARGEQPAVPAGTGRIKARLCCPGSGSGLQSRRL
ncbi:hypothetical protein EYF80_068426 [Liparis tanakae]|uniref:Uncharacterized protein n=1 Tax=Liparis tanakae TaxID=230148 RepID=A0A4Z2DY16_9TELE|nr:hypothetical protein EYF80_068426 [Liparis tanakae]